jgi:hypothetical protein
LRARANTFYISSISHRTPCCTSHFNMSLGPALLSVFIHSGVSPLILGANHRIHQSTYSFGTTVFFFLVSFLFLRFYQIAYTYVCSPVGYLSIHPSLSVSRLFLFLRIYHPSTVHYPLWCSNKIRLSESLSLPTSEIMPRLAAAHNRSRSIKWRWVCRYMNHVIEAFGKAAGSLNIGHVASAAHSSAQLRKAPWAIVGQTDLSSRATSPV